MFTIYGLYEKNSTVPFYVGVTKRTCAQRLHCHMHDSRNLAKRGSKVSAAAKRIYALGTKPEIVPLFMTSSAACARVIEEYVIHAARCVNANLANVHAGGLGFQQV